MSAATSATMSTAAAMSTTAAAMSTTAAAMSTTAAVVSTTAAAVSAAPAKIEICNNAATDEQNQQPVFSNPLHRHHPLKPEQKSGPMSAFSATDIK